MKDKIYISVIIPFFNSKKYILKCLKSIFNQSFDKKFEIILIDDGSNDGTSELIKSHYSKLKIITLKFNKGPSVARNIGLENAKGEYLFFLDADDTIDKDTFKILYNIAQQKDYDLVYADKKKFENNINLRETKYIYSYEKEFKNNDIIKDLKERIFNPSHMQGSIGLHSKLIKRSVVLKNKILFEEKLRWLEDEIFMWNIYKNINKMKYVPVQLYNYYSNPNINTARSMGLVNEFKLDYFKLIKKNIEDTFIKFGLKKNEVLNLGNRAYIYFIIYALISISLSINNKKIDLKIGKKSRKKFINNIVNDKSIIRAARNYSPSKNESYWLPKSLIWKIPFIVELFCDLRVNNIIKQNRLKN